MKMSSKRNKQYKEGLSRNEGKGENEDENFFPPHHEYIHQNSWHPRLPIANYFCYELISQSGFPYDTRNQSFV